MSEAPGRGDWSVWKSSTSGWWHWRAMTPHGIRRSGSTMTRWGAKRVAKAAAGTTHFGTSVSTGPKEDSDG